ncbi:MAG: hypothetical protein K1X72_25285 [Pyrinomonadaceae bacterium]|nr:hypothetical protein [Pyrinomonadaceae bacterium]
MNELLSHILAKRHEVPVEQSLLVGISGIDASGKGFISAKLVKELENKGFRVANINVDGWLDLPQIRFSQTNPAKIFYEKAIRFDEMFEKLILALKENRSIDLIADLIEETAAEFHQHHYFHENIDIILLEGIFLFKPQFIEYFDLKIWIECSFETALQRAIKRNQESLSTKETINTYQTIFFPAQTVHLSKDKPIEQADIVFDNDQEHFAKSKTPL